MVIQGMGQRLNWVRFYGKFLVLKHGYKDKMASDATPDKSQSFNTSAAPPASEVARFFKAVQSNDSGGLLPILMAWPRDATRWTNSDGLTGLMLSAQAGHKEVSWLLIHASKEDLEIGNQNDSTALMFAAHYGKASVVAMLLEAGADVNHANKNGHTALISAAANGFRNTTEQLLKYNADTALKDLKGDDAAAYARENNNAEIAVMIEKAAVAQAEAKAKAAPPEKPQHLSPVWDDNSEAIEALRKEMVKAKLAK